MKAIIIESPGGPEKLKIKAVTKPQPGKGQALIKVKAFGINRAELYMREGKWPEIAEIIGIECVGLIEYDPSGTFKTGQKVAAIMGGMGRSINGSYAEFTCAPLTNLIAIDTGLEWNMFAAIPESFASAWGALNMALQIEKGQTLLIRGATSAFGLAAIILAKQAGLTVIGTTRSEQKRAMLINIGADYVFIENSGLLKNVRQIFPNGTDWLLDLIGSTTIMNSSKIAKPEGMVCMAGFLGGRSFMDRFQSFAEKTLQKKGSLCVKLPGRAKVVVFASSAFGTRHFPLSKIPLQKIVSDIEEKIIPSIIAGSYRFEEIAKAHEQLGNNKANGKIVVVL